MQYRTPPSSSESISGFKKKPLKWVEHPLNQFNDIAIPQRVDLLRKHKSNVERFLRAGDFEKANREHMNAVISIRQLKRDLSDIEDLRSQIVENDLEKFDLITRDTRSNAAAALEEYLQLRDLQEQGLGKFSKVPKVDQGGGANFGGPDADLRQRVHHSGTDPVPFESTSGVAQQQLQSWSIDQENLEDYLRSFESLQEDLVDLHHMFKDLSEICHDQAELIGSVEENVEETQQHVEAGTRQLGLAARYKTALYPLAGAVIGTCIGGPVGLLAGLKLGGLAAVGCGAVGFMSGRFIKKKQEEVILSQVKPIRPMRRNEDDFPNLILTPSSQGSPVTPTGVGL